MLKSELQQRLHQANVPEDIAQIGFSAYDYLSNPKLCRDGEAYSWDIAAGVFGHSLNGPGVTDKKMEVALDIFVDNEILLQLANKRYTVRQQLIDE